MWVYDSPGYLYHYGVKGMRWGVRKEGESKKRRLPSRDPRNVEDKKTIKNIDKDLLTIKKRYGAQSDIYRKANRELSYIKRQKQDDITKRQMDKQQKKSKRQEKFEKRYLEQGFTKQESELMAFKRARTEKLLIAAGVVTVGATAVMMSKHHGAFFDRTIRKGTLLQNISTDGDKGVADAFYASRTKMDNMKYKGLMGTQLRLIYNDPTIFKTKIGLNEDIRVASNKTAIRIMREMVAKNPEYGKNIAREMDASKKASATRIPFDKAAANLRAGKVDSTTYNAFNVAMVNHTPDNQKLVNAFFDEMKSRGYGAIRDVNDSKYSGYGSRDPLIIFDGGSKTSVISRNKMSTDEVGLNLNLSAAFITTNAIGVSVAKYHAVKKVMNTKKSLSEVKKNNAIVMAYRNEHPESELSYNDIVLNYGGY